MTHPQVVQDFFRNNPLNLGVPNDGAADVSEHTHIGIYQHTYQ